VFAKFSGRTDRRTHSTAAADADVSHLDVRIYIINNTAKSNHLHVLQN